MPRNRGWQRHNEIQSNRFVSGPKILRLPSAGRGSNVETQRTAIMSWQIELIRAAEFVRLGPEGEFNLSASKAALAAVAAACRKRGVDNAILDLRALQPGPKPVFTTTDLLELVNTFPAAGFTKRLRLAILYRSDPHKRARLFAFVSTLHGWKVSAFANFEQALAWLTNCDERAEAADEASAGKPIRITNTTQRRTLNPTPHAWQRAGERDQRATRNMSPG